MHHFDIAHLFHYIPPEFRYIHVARVAHHGTRAEHSSMSREKWVETLLVDLITTTTTTTTNEKKYTRTIVENAHAYCSSMVMYFHSHATANQSWMPKGNFRISFVYWLEHYLQIFL